MKNYLKKFYTEERGSVIEYIIVLAVIAGIIVAIFPKLQTTIMGWFKGSVNKIDPGTSGQCPDGQNSYYNTNAVNPSGLPTWAKSAWDPTLGLYTGQATLPANQIASIVCHTPNVAGAAPQVNGFGI